MFISRKEVYKRPNYTRPFLKVYNDGRFYLSKKLTEILEIENTKDEGFVLGYTDEFVYIAYSKEELSFKGSFKNKPSGIQFANKVEQTKIYNFFKIKFDKYIKLDLVLHDFVIEQGYKFYKLKRF